MIKTIHKKKCKKAKWLPEALLVAEKGREVKGKGEKKKKKKINPSECRVPKNSKER